METWIPRSSNLDQCTYDAGTKTLQVFFQNGTAYEYSGVPESVWQSFQHAPSPGSYFYANVRNRYPYQEI